VGFITTTLAASPSVSDVPSGTYQRPAARGVHGSAATPRPSGRATIIDTVAGPPKNSTTVPAEILSASIER
jgi:hypothetical protein